MNEREPTVRSRELGLALFRATAAQGLKRIELAERLGWSHTKISRIFNGKRGVMPEDVAAILAICGVTGPKRDELLTLTRNAHDPHPARRSDSLGRRREVRCPRPHAPMSRSLRWRKSSRTNTANCVELAWPAAIRDSKHPAPTLSAALAPFIVAAKSGALDLRRSPLDAWS